MSSELLKHIINLLHMHLIRYNLLKKLINFTVHVLYLNENHENEIFIEISNYEYEFLYKFLLIHT